MNSVVSQCNVKQEKHKGWRNKASYPYVMAKVLTGNCREYQLSLRAKSFGGGMSILRMAHLLRLL